MGINLGALDEAGEAIGPLNQDVTVFHGILLLYYNDFRVADMPVKYGLSAMIRSTARAGAAGTDRFTVEAKLASGETSQRVFEVKIAE